MSGPTRNGPVYTFGLLDGLVRHSWMRAGVTYVGNGTYTLAEAIRRAIDDGTLTKADARLWCHVRGRTFPGQGATDG